MVPEYYKEDDVTDTVDVYSYKESYIKKFYNRHPKVNRLDIVYGRIVSREVRIGTGLKVGMKKEAALEFFFKLQDSVVSSISELTIYENELRSNWVSLIFKNDKLVKVEFDSEYEWINKEWNGNIE